MYKRQEEQLGMDQINRYNMYSTAAVTCNVAPGSSSGAVSYTHLVEMKDSTGQPVHQLLKITLRHNMTMVKTESVPN